MQFPVLALFFVKKGIENKAFRNVALVEALTLYQTMLPPFSDLAELFLQDFIFFNYFIFCRELNNLFFFFLQQKIEK